MEIERKDIETADDVARLVREFTAGSIAMMSCATFSTTWHR